MATYGGFTVLNISASGAVRVRKAMISGQTVEALNRNLLIFYTGITRHSDEILQSQAQAAAKRDREVVENMHNIKELGYRILKAVEDGQISKVGPIFHEHWQCKKKTSNKISNEWLDDIYRQALASGASGGKISGAGGGGFFTFYVEKNQAQFSESMNRMGLKELRYCFDFEGTKVLSRD